MSSDRPSRHPIRAVAVFVFVVHTLATVDGQTPQPRPPGDPQVFRASAELIRLDVSITDEKGVPVSDLQATDFEVLQDGKPQRVQFAEYRAADVAAARAPGMSAAEARSRAGVDGTVNSATPEAAGRHLLFIVDDLHTHFDSIAHVREDLSRFADNGLQPGDQMRILGTRDPHDSSRTFTSDRGLIRRQIETLHWEANPFRPGMRRILCGAMSEDLVEPGGPDGTLAVLAAAITDLRNYPGRKTVLLLSDRIEDPCPEYRTSYYERLRRITDLAARSSATVYGLHTLQFSSGVRMPEYRAEAAGSFEGATVHNEVSDSLRRLAEPTGGFARRSNSVRDLIDLALADQQGYYSLAYEPPAGTFAGKKLRYRTITVRMHQKNVVVRTRGGFYNVTDDSVLLRP